MQRMMPPEKAFLKIAVVKLYLTTDFEGKQYTIAVPGFSGLHSFEMRDIFVFVRSMFPELETTIGKATLAMKNLPFLCIVSRSLAVTLLCIVSWCAVSCASQSSCCSPEGTAFVAGMGYGWNLGNTFDALPNGNVRRAGLETENAWGNPLRTMISPAKEGTSL